MPTYLDRRAAASGPPLKLSVSHRYSAALGSPRVLARAKQLISTVAMHVLHLALEGVRFLLSGMDYLFAVTLFSSWLWLCLEEVRDKGRRGGTFLARTQNMRAHIYTKIYSEISLVHGFFEISSEEWIA